MPYPKRLSNAAAGIHSGCLFSREAALAGNRPAGFAILKHLLFGSLVLGFAAPPASADLVQLISGTLTEGNTAGWWACYNGNQSVSPFGVPCGTGFSQGGNPGVGGSEQTTGTMDATGLATSAYMNVSLTGANGTTATANTSGSLVDGTLHSFTAGSLPGPPSGGAGYSSGALFDNITFTVAGADASTVTPIVVTWSWDGSLSGASASAATADGSVNLGGSVSVSTILGGTGPVFEVGTGATANGWESYTFTSNTPSLVSFTGVYDLVGSSVMLPFNMHLDTSGQDGDTADFSNTAQVGLILPSNVSYTSGSGAFLTAGSSPVPEPSSYILMLSAALGVFAVARRRRVFRSANF